MEAKGYTGIPAFGQHGKVFVLIVISLSLAAPGHYTERGKKSMTTSLQSSAFANAANDEMIYIPSGDFLKGLNPEEAVRLAKEYGVHESLFGLESHSSEFTLRRSTLIATK